MRSIGYSSFGGCTGLTSLTLPEGLSEIGWVAFYNCTGLTTLTLPESLTFIGEFAFKDCTSLTTVKAKMPKPFTLDTLAFDNIGVTCKLIVPYGTKEAYETAGWTDEVFLGGVEEMPGGSCGPNLTWTYDTDTRHLTITGTGEMNNSGNERSKPWYSYQWDITSVSLPYGLTRIGSHAFSNCSALATINIPESVTSIGRCAFIGCRSLNAINLPDGLTVIDYCFAGCSALTSVTLPPHVTYISEAFTRCSALTTVKALMTEPCTLGKDAFSEIDPACKLIIPAGTRQAYIDAGWTTDIFPGGIVEMGDANLDGTISVADVGLMIDCILGNAPSGVDPAIADVNDDGEVNVDDLETVIKAMLAK
ncbi:MAG: leucine-rich repeat protein [Prevotella sp.]|nr:leucine-rich repeat protein [Prevotella sp.]